MSNKLKYEDVKNYVESKNCKLLSKEYKNNSSKLDFKCLCGNVYTTTFQIFKANKKHQCKDCGLDIKRKKFAKTTDKFKEEVRDIDDDFEVLGKYYNSKTKIKMLYKPKDKIIEITPDDFLCGKRGYCYGKSNGENKIEEFLLDRDINFDREYIFKDLIFIRPLRFDFAILDNNNNLKVLIEYDGEAHYMPIKFSSKLTEKDVLDNFNEYKFKDELKNKYCEDNNILLIRIPYWELENIEIILEDIVSTL